MQKKYLYTAISVIFLSVITWYAMTLKTTTEHHHEFPTIDSFTQIQKTFDTLPSDAIVFFDIHETLITSPDYLPRHLKMPLLCKVLSTLKHPSFLYKKGYKEKLFSIILRQGNNVLTENLIPFLINNLKDRGITVIIITAMDSGSYGTIESMPGWRATMLKELGIIPSQHLANTTFIKLPIYRGNHPVFYNGILCCNQQPKGVVIEAFLKQFNLQPSTIMHLDDSLLELASSKILCERNGIYGKHYCYNGAKLVNPPAWSLRRTLKQIDHLVAFEEWISDSEANTKSVI
jgi:hypothetical protein